jgi:hypothetical protein
MAQQYGGYNQVGHGTNPFDERAEDGAADGRFNNYAQGRYDDRTFDARIDFAQAWANVSQLAR